MPSKNKKKQQQFNLANRIPVWEFKPKAELWNGPDAYDIPLPSNARASLISPAPRFDHERQATVEEARKKREASMQEKHEMTVAELQKKRSGSGGKASQELRMAELSWQRARPSTPKKEEQSTALARDSGQIFKAIEVPARAANFSTSELRFDFEKQEALLKMRAERQQKLVEKAEQMKNMPPPLVKTKANKKRQGGEPEEGGAGGSSSRKKSKHGVDLSKLAPRYLENPPPEVMFRQPRPSDLDVERGRKSVEPRCPVPVIRPEQELTEAEKKRIAASKRPLLEEEKQHIAAAESNNTIQQFVRTSKMGDFSRGSERHFFEKKQSCSPGAIYEPNLDAVRPHMTAPFIRPPPEKKEHSDSSAASLSPTGKRMRDGPSDEDRAETAQRAMAQLDKIHPRAPSTVISMTSPISASMPYAFNIGNFCNSRSMRALLCDGVPMNVKRNCEAIIRADPELAAQVSAARSRSPAAASRKKMQQQKQKSSAAEAGDTDVSSNDRSAAADATTPQPKTHNRFEFLSASRSGAGDSAAFIESGIASPFCRRTPSAKANFSLCQLDPQHTGLISASEANASALAAPEGSRRGGHSPLCFRRDLGSGLPQLRGDDYDDDGEEKWSSYRGGADGSTRSTSHQQVVSPFSRGAMTPEPFSTVNNNQPKWSYAHKKGSNYSKGDGVPLAVLLKKQKLERQMMFKSSGVQFGEVGGESADRLKHLQEF